MKLLSSRADDALTDLLRALRVRSTVYCLSDLGAPWGLRILASDVAKFHVVLKGKCVLDVAEDRCYVLELGDLVILPGGEGHTVRDDPSSRVTRLEDVLAKTPLDERGRLHYGGDGTRTLLLCGGFELEGAEIQPVLDLLPTVVHVDGAAAGLGRWIGATLELLDAERGAPGLPAVAGRVSDVLLTQALRVFLGALAGTGARNEVLADPQIAHAVQAIHRDLADPWTVNSLARCAAMSRSAFSARFRELVGEPPMRYLTRSRLARAASYLATTRMPVDRVARLVGYNADASLSKAFKRETGMTPGAYRRSCERQPAELGLDASVAAFPETAAHR